MNDQTPMTTAAHRQVNPGERMSGRASAIDTTARQDLCGAQWRTPWRAVAGAAFAASLAAFALIAAPAGAQAPAQPPGYGGVWLDHSGDGAVEISPCGDRLCGRIVWLKSPTDPTGKPLADGNNADARQRQRPICGLPVIGNLKRQPDGAWDEGWIYDPKQGKQFDVELKLRSQDTLQVMGYLGVKFLSETFMWRRISQPLKRCGTV